MSKRWTYLLEAKRPEELESLQHPEWKVRRKWRRAIVVTYDETAVPPFEFIRRKLSGDQMIEQVKHWLNRSILDDAHDEYVKASPVPARAMRAAEERWRRALVAQERAKIAFEKAVQAEREASLEIVKTHGKGPLVYKGIVYHANYHEDHSANSQVMGGGGVYVWWTDARKYRPKKGTKS